MWWESRRRARETLQRWNPRDCDAGGWAAGSTVILGLGWETTGWPGPPETAPGGERAWRGALTGLTQWSVGKSVSRAFSFSYLTHSHFWESKEEDRRGKGLLVGESGGSRAVAGDQEEPAWAGVLSGGRRGLRGASSAQVHDSFSLFLLFSRCSTSWDSLSLDGS